MSEERPSEDGGERPRTFERAHVWVTSTYYAEGFPYSLVNNVADILFKELGASLTVVRPRVPPRRQPDSRSAWTAPAAA